MNLNLIYFSPTRTTEKIVKTIAEGIGADYKDYNITMDKNRKNSLSFENEDLIIVGVPVYGGRIPVILEEFLRNLKGERSRIFLIAVYGNRHYDDALLEMKDIFEENNFEVVGAAGFIAEHSYTHKVAGSRPDKNDLDIAKNLGIDLGKKLKNKIEIDIKIPGNRPYKERKVSEPFGPITNELCNHCGKCIAVCPREAIDSKDPYKINTEKCIHCCACIKICPEKAKSFENEGIKKITKFLEDNFSKERKEPEIFI